MTRDDQKALLVNLCNSVRDALLARSEHWPEDWTGHHLRELIAYAFDCERSCKPTPYNRGDAHDKRVRREVSNAIAVDNLY